MPITDRPEYQPSDLAYDVILTLCPESKDHPKPIFHRQNIPQWTDDQIKTIGRYTTGPLFTHWTKL